MPIIFLLIIVDYIFTYIGIQKLIITEANPLMGWLFTCNFEQGLIIRVVMAVILLVPFYMCKKHNIMFYKKSVLCVIIIYIPVMILHARWVFYLLTS